MYSFRREGLITGVLTFALYLIASSIWNTNDNSLLIRLLIALVLAVLTFLATVTIGTLLARRAKTRA